MAKLTAPGSSSRGDPTGLLIDALAGIGYRGGNEEGANEVVNFYCPDDWICRV